MSNLLDIGVEVFRQSLEDQIAPLPKT